MQTQLHGLGNNLGRILELIFKIVFMKEFLGEYSFRKAFIPGLNKNIVPRRTDCENIGSNVEIDLFQKWNYIFNIDTSEQWTW